MTRNNNNNTPYVRKKIPSTLFAFSAIALLVLASSPMLFSHFLLQPAQAQSNTLSVSVRMPLPANGTMTQSGDSASITFDAQVGPQITEHEWGLVEHIK